MMQTKSWLLVLSMLVLPLCLAADNMAEGQRLYAQTCAACHGEDGQVNEDMQLVVKPRNLVKSILTEQQMEKVITYGGMHYGAHSDIMPAFQTVYSKEQIHALAQYVHKTFTKKRDKRVKKLLSEADLTPMNEEKMMHTGKKIFTRNCSLCHGVTGNGKDSIYIEESKANKDFLYPYNLQKILLDEQQIFLYIKFGGHYWGSYKKDMPSWKKKYNDQKLRSVAKFVMETIVAKQ